MALNLKPASACRFDLVSLGEVMLRLDPGDTRIHTARTFQVWEGGGEYNVARGLKRCFGLRTAVVTAFVDNPVGRLLQDLLYQGGVDQSYVRFVPDDGVGRTVRNGLNFTERGFGVRAAVGCSDRGHTAASQMKPGDVDWDAALREGGRPLVPHRRDLRRPLRDDAPRGEGGDGGGEEARHHRLLRPQLPRVALEVDRREEARAGGEPRARRLRRRDARQRGGLHRRPRLRGRGPRREPLGPRPGATSRR